MDFLNTVVTAVKSLFSKVSNFVVAFEGLRPSLREEKTKKQLVTELLFYFKIILAFQSICRQWI
jgi:hypothetical protein